MSTSIYQLARHQRGGGPPTYESWSKSIKEKRDRIQRKKHGEAIRRRKALNRPWHLYEMDKPTKERKCQSDNQ